MNICFLFLFNYFLNANNFYLICSNCGKIIDYSDFMEDEITYLNKIQKQLEKKHNFKINSHLIHFYELCKKCK
ncbi:MAG: transcriptional repressor [Spirochaetes bacterium]|nr:transcriptional repressor [Spirochaetota bacterium]